MVPQKYFYTIGEVCKLTGVKPHILRYWESEFKLLRPARRYSGHRKFTQRDLDLINRIKYLIIERKYKLAGAKKELNRWLNPKSTEEGTGTSKIPLSAIPLLNEIKKDIDDCLTLLTPESAQEELAALV